MNPFDWRGPEFLVFYLLFGLAVLALLYLARTASEPAGEVRADLSDPYLIASLRGGSAEVLRVATISLIDRALLKASDDKVRVTKNADRAVTQPVERAALFFFQTRDEAAALLSDSSAKKAAAPYEERLRALGYLPDRSTTSHRLKIFVIALAALWLVAGLKIILAIERERPYSFLVVLAVMFPIAATAVTFPRQTRRGRRALDDLKVLFRDSRQIGATGDELLYAAAVLGVAGLSTEHAWTRKLFPISDSGGSSGSSCGSSCGGGCGGGCGGCGS